MQHVYLVLGWTFGSLFLLIGLVALVENPFSGLSSIGIAALLIPPFRYALFRRVSRAIPVPHIAVAVIVLFVTFALFAGNGWGVSAQGAVVWLVAIGIAVAALIVGATRSQQQNAIEQDATLAGRDILWLDARIEPQNCPRLRHTRRA